jgi:hypothetical protein
VDGSDGTDGLDGSNGIDGTAGLDGVQGVIGAAGVDGIDGANGANGADGLDGSDGVAGADGASGADGVNGADGLPGPAGADGATGADGAIGPEGTNGLAEYGYFYNTSDQVVPLGGAVTFDSDGVATDGVTHAPGASGVTLVEGGTYKVAFSVSGTEPNQMALFVQGTAALGAIYGSGAGTQQNSGQVIVVANPGDVLSVRNHRSSAAIGLAGAPPIGGTQPATNASILIEKLG